MLIEISDPQIRVIRGFCLATELIGCWENLTCLFRRSLALGQLLLRERSHSQQSTHSH